MEPLRKSKGASQTVKTSALVIEYIGDTNYVVLTGEETYNTQDLGFKGLSGMD